MEKSPEVVMAKIKCDRGLYTRLRNHLIYPHDNCIFHDMPEIKECLGARCEECFETFINRILTSEEQKEADEAAKLREQRRRKESGDTPIVVQSQTAWMRSRFDTLTEAITESCKLAYKVNSAWVDEREDLRIKLGL